MLFAAFHKSALNCLHLMEQCYMQPDGEQWRKQAHGLKGLAANIGAAPLAGLCYMAESAQMAPAPERYRILQQIEEEYGRVRDYLDQTDQRLV